MELGVFSISLTVKNLTVSKEFYEKLGFTVFGGDLKMNYLIMKNGNSLIGLFQGMFDKNILTFNPGWDINADTLESFDDVRTIQARLKSQNLELDQEADEQTSGPASITLTESGWESDSDRPAYINCLRLQKPRIPLRDQLPSVSPGRSSFAK